MGLAGNRLEIFAMVGWSLTSLFSRNTAISETTIFAMVRLRNQYTSRQTVRCDYVEEVTYYPIFDVDRLSGGFSPNRWNITLLWLISCPVLFSRSNAHLEPLGRYSRFMAQITWFRPRTVLLGLGRWLTFFGGTVHQKPPKKERE